MQHTSTQNMSISTPVSHAVPVATLPHVVAVRVQCVPTAALHRPAALQYQRSHVHARSHDNYKLTTYHYKCGPGVRSSLIAACHDAFVRPMTCLRRDKKLECEHQAPAFQATTNFMPSQRRHYGDAVWASQISCCCRCADRWNYT
jgi:hypothetical protein